VLTIRSTAPARGTLAIVFLASLTAQPVFPSDQIKIPFAVPNGVALRIILPKRVLIRHAGQPIEGLLAEPVYAYDREVLPAGTEVLGHLANVQPVSHWRRAQEIMDGNLAPLHTVEVQFDTLVLNGNRRIPISTSVAPGAARMSDLEISTSQGTAKSTHLVSGVVVYCKRQITSRERAAMALMRGPGKRQRIMNDAKSWIKSKLPYHREEFPSGTVFTAELTRPLNFGTETRPAGDLLRPLHVSLLAPDGVLHARLSTPLSSATAHVGTRVEAIVTQPVSSPSGQLVIPEGTRLTGTVVQVQAARKLNRDGNLRFRFRRLDVQGLSPEKIEGSLEGVEAPCAEDLELDSEGGIRPKPSMQKYIAASLAVLATVWTATPTFDNRRSSQGAVPGQDHAAGEVAAGGWKLGLLGSLVTLAAQSRAVTAGFGAYGAAWSIYSHLLARGRDVVLPANTPIEIRFESRRAQASGNGRPPGTPSSRRPRLIDQASSLAEEAQ
jgi:hypothetical protein